MLSSADSHEASGAPGEESWRPHLALPPWAKPLANPSGRAVPPWVPICSLWWRRCVPSLQSTTRPSEGPCCSLGQGWAGVGGSRIAGFLHSMPITPISVVLSVWYLLCTVTCVPVLGGLEGWRSTTHHVGSPFHPGNDMGRACTGSDQCSQYTVHYYAQCILGAKAIHGANVTMGFAANLRMSDGTMRRFLRLMGTAVEITSHPSLHTTIMFC